MTDQQLQPASEPPDRTGDERPDLFRVKRPSRAEVRAYGAGLVGAASLSGYVPHTAAMGGVTAAVVLADFLREHLRR